MTCIRRRACNQRPHARSVHQQPLSTSCRIVNMQGFRLVQCFHRIPDGKQAMHASYAQTQTSQLRIICQAGPSANRPTFKPTQAFETGHRQHSQSTASIPPHIGNLSTQRRHRLLASEDQGASVPRVIVHGLRQNPCLPCLCSEGQAGVLLPPRSTCILPVAPKVCLLRLPSDASFLTGLKHRARRVRWLKLNIHISIQTHCWKGQRTYPLCH